MFVIQMREAAAGLRDYDEVDALIRGLGSRGYSPSIRTMVRAGFEVAGVTPSGPQLPAILGTGRRYRARDDQSPPIGDLFFTDAEALLLQPTGAKLIVWGIRHHKVESTVDDFCKAIADTAAAVLDGRRLRGMDFTWKARDPSIREVDPFRRSTRGADRLKSKPPEYSPSDAENSELLSAQESRQFLLRLAQVRGKARSIDADEEAGIGIVQPLLDGGLLGREYLIICRQDSHTICSVQEKAQLEAGVLGSAKCTICGRPFSNELIQDIFALSDSGTKLLSKSHWMTIWVTELLKEAGIDPAWISWNAASGDDEIDIIANIFGTRVFFELKDREFGVGDAYPFLYRVERYGGSYGVVLSTERVADEVKRLFEERAPGVGSVPIETLEGNDSIRSQLPRLVDRLSRVPARRVVNQFAEAVDLNPVAILNAWMDAAARQRGGGA